MAKDQCAYSAISVPSADEIFTEFVISISAVEKEKTRVQSSKFRVKVTRNITDILADK